MTLSTKEIDGLIALIEYHKNEGWYNVIETTDLMSYESGELLKKLSEMRDEV
jgi:Na+-transporting NADH:ubiquinone oxidoreductase subunit NqrB